MDIPCRSKNVNKYYRVIAEVGSGTYGKVYKAECLKTNDFVALKKIDTRDPKIISEGFPITAIREIKLLKMMSHKNIIRLREIIVSKASIRNNYRGSTFLVFDYMDHDFAGLHRMKNTFNLAQLKCIFKQILEGVKYLHENRIIHRDLKSANLLLNNKGEVSIADFGLARTMSILPNAKYTYKVVTLWYRAPELLMGQSNYTYQIDLWSVGCIFAELLTGDVLFKGDTEYRQMEKIYEICGSATEYNWPECVKLRQYEELKPRRNHERVLQKHLRDLRPSLDQYSLDILDNLLVLDPSKRLTAVQALNHDFFKQDPKPCSLKEMPHLDKEFHETLFKNEMRLQQQQHQQQHQQQQQQQQQQQLLKPKSSQQVTSFNADKPFQSHGLQRFQSQKADQQGSLQMLQKVMESKSLIDQRESRKNNDKDREVQQRMDQQQQQQQRPSSKQPNYKDVRQSPPARQDAAQTVQLDDMLESIISRDTTKQDKNISASAAFGIDEEPLLRKKYRQSNPQGQ